MNALVFPRRFRALALVLLGLIRVAPPGDAADAAAVRQRFANPPREYASAPLWVWNDLLSEQQIRDTLRDLAGQKVKQAFVHPRPGLMTPYLSPDWFRLWKVALQEAERLDMNIWIYDENSYPSGFAGGWVPELMPESRGRGLALREAKTTPTWTDATVAVFRLQGSEAADISQPLRSGKPIPEGPYLVAEVVRARNSPWHGNRCYVDLLYPGVTAKFIDVTLEAYKREIGDQFGRRVPGVFTDEPNINPAGGLPWTDDLPDQFQKRWGYALVPNLASLVRPVGEWKKIRHNYYATLNDLFIERWAKPIYEWCEQNRLEFTGHYWDHEWPNCAGVPDNMAMYAWHQRPAIDCLMNQYAEHTHAQFGNVRMVRELASVANQLGRKRTLCELYGAGGWDLRFEDMKRIADWLAVLGVNTLDEHLSYITLRGARKRDHPQSFSYHEPWWDDYHLMAAYLTRLSLATSQGEQIHRILVIEPTTTAWMYQGDGAKLKEIGDSFFQLLMALEAAQIEYDLGDEDILARFGRPSDDKVPVGDRDPVAPQARERQKGRSLQIGQRQYDLIVFPPAVENLNRKTAELLDQVSCPKLLPWATHRDGSPMPANESATLSRSNAMAQVGLAKLHRELIETIREHTHTQDFEIRRLEGDPGILFHQRRKLDDGQLLLLVNTSLEHRSRGVVACKAQGVEAWNLFTGAVEPYPAVKTDGGISTRFDLPPSGSLLLFLSDQPTPQRSWPAEVRSEVSPSGPLEVRRVEPNVLTLDYVDVTAGDETRTNVYFYQANQFAWKKNGMERNPWDSAVQFKDELITRRAPADSGFKATYRFTIDGPVPPDLELVLERPDLYTTTCNGQPLQARKGAWWLDKAFGRLPLAPLARTGDNEVTLVARPFTMFHELESAYVLGRFSLRPSEKGFVITPDHPLAIKPAQSPVVHAVNPDGTMWLSGGIGFSHQPDGRPVEDRAPFVVFDLGKPADLISIHIWNYGESHVTDLTPRGTKRLRIACVAAGTADAPVEAELGTFDLPRVSGQARAVPLPVKASKARWLKFTLLENHHGVTYPATGEPPDNGFVGLAEVQFLEAPDSPLEGVRIAVASSDLPSHSRIASHMVDGSGLSTARPGWNDQGHPFYAEGVAYEQKFTLANPQGRLLVCLPSWYGSVARVRVNGDLAGCIAAPPWELDVTRELAAGENRIEVTVIGTLKNTLGPHHGNHALGSAWPGMFQNGPPNGPPPGTSYHTVGYGLFAPFQLVRQSAGTAAQGP